MKTRMGTLAALVAAVALAAGCGSSSGAGTNGGGTPNTTVRSSPNSQLGTSALVNHTGMTLYTLSAETGGRLSAPRARRSRAAAPRACRCGSR